MSFLGRRSGRRLEGETIRKGRRKQPRCELVCLAEAVATRGSCFVQKDAVNLQKRPSSHTKKAVPNRHVLECIQHGIGAETCIARKLQSAAGRVCRYLRREFLS